MKLFALSGVVLMTLFAASRVEAQTCLGGPAFQPNPYQARVAGLFTDVEHGIDAAFAAGGESLFAGGGLSVENFRPQNQTATSVSGFAGADLQADDGGRIFLCPLAALSFGVGPDFLTTDVSTVRLRGGGQVGVIAMQNGTMMVVPTFGLAAVHQRVRFDFGPTDTTVSDNFGLANIGVGFVFNRNVAITPGVTIPFSADDSDVIVTFGLTFNFGG